MYNLYNDKCFSGKNIYFLLLLGLLFILTTGCKKNNNNSIDNNTVKDIDGNVYNTVTIDTQVWMVENLKVTKYLNSNPIPNINDSAQWSILTTGAYCNYDNNESYVTTYGRLYNWYAVNDSRNICPTGWHVPTDADWSNLTNFLGGENVAGAKLKETGTKHWRDPNAGATNETGFTALPGGSRYNSTFVTLTLYGFWWSASEENQDSAWIRIMRRVSSDIGRFPDNKKNGFSIRCIKN